MTFPHTPDSMLSPMTAMSRLKAVAKEGNRCATLNDTTTKDCRKMAGKNNSINRSDFYCFFISIMDRFLHTLYYNSRKSPVAFSGAGTIYAYAKRIKPEITFKNVNDFLQKQHVHSMHKQAPRKFRRNKVIAVGKDSHWQADLMDMRNIAKKNSGYNYILNVVDVLSKYGFSEPVKSKSANQVAQAFELIMKRSGRRPWFLYVDKGREFKGEFKDLMSRSEINLYATESPEIKASNAERFNRTLRNRLHKYFTASKTLRYVEVLPRIVDGINNSVSRPLGARPVDVTFSNEMDFWKKLYGDPTKRKKAKFRHALGARVRIRMEKNLFHRGYLPQFSKTIFIVTEQLARDPPVYRIKDAKSNEDITGIFYDQELVAAAI